MFPIRLEDFWETIQINRTHEYSSLTMLEIQLNTFPDVMLVYSNLELFISVSSVNLRLLSRS